MKAVILVGGEGTRLRPLTYTTPKQLLPVCEVPMLERVLGRLADNGVSEAVLALGYRPDGFVDAYPDGKACGVRLSYAVEPEPLDTAGAVAFAARHADIETTFVVVNGDVLNQLDLVRLVEFHRRHQATATISLVPVEDPSRFGVVPTDEDGRVLEFVEKPAPHQAPTNLINAGTYVLEPAVLSRIPPGRRVSIERETFPELAAEGAVYALAEDGYWLDIGTPEAYLQAQRDFLTGAAGFGRPPAPGAREVAPGVWAVGKPSVVGEVRGPALVGDAASVGQGALVQRSVVGRGAQVGRGAVVEDSVLLAGSSVGDGATVRGSIIGYRGRVGVGAVIEPLTVVGDDGVVFDDARLRGGRVEGHR